MIKSIAFFVALFLVSLSQAQTIYYNGANLVFDRNGPVVSRGVVMLPARDTVARIGAFLDRNESGRRVTLSWEFNRIDYRQGDTVFRMNDRTFSAGGSSADINGVLYLPFEIFRKLTNGQLSMDRGGNNRPDRDVQVMFDGRTVDLRDNVAPYTKQGIVMVPFRALGDAIGASTNRTPDGLRVTINFGRDRVEYDKGHIWFRLNGERRSLRVTSEDRGNVLFVPIGLYSAVTNGRVRAR